jgi:signal transduction histidine kinase
VSKSVPVSRSRLERLLVLGLGLSALLLLSALLIAFRAVHQIDEDTQTFADRQALGKAAIDEIERQQNDLNTRWLQLAERKDVVRREEILDELAQTRAQMSSALESAYEQAEFLRESIYQEGHGLLRWTVWLFAICVGLSILCASWTVRASADLFKRLEQQAGELARMQYQFLETQEHTLRRFSHELHDELGQALTAVKANLSALRGEADEARVNDTMHLVDRAIQDVREMSQLLRPTILDDFGLDAALRSLTESFAQRTGINVNYQSNMDGRRLSDQAETNLYRIGQEALTNIARHSGATIVGVDLALKGDDLRLSIRDNGRGFDVTQRRDSHGLGLAGIETRARGCGGTLTLETSPGKGLAIEVSCPVPTESMGPAQEGVLADGGQAK